MTVMSDNQRFLRNVKWAKMRILIIIAASTLVIIQLSAPLLPAFIAISQLVMLIIDYRKTKSPEAGRE